MNGGIKEGIAAIRRGTELMQGFSAKLDAVKAALAPQSPEAMAVVAQAMREDGGGVEMREALEAMCDAATDVATRIKELANVVWAQTPAEEQA